MRKIQTFSAIFLIFFILAGTALYTRAAVTEDGKTWAELSQNHELQFETPLNSASYLKGIFLFPKGEFDRKEAAAIIMRVDHIPPRLLEKIVEHKIKIKLFNGKLTDNRTAADLKGKLPRGYGNAETTWDDVPGLGGSRNVLIKIGFSERGNNHGSVNLELHELGHSVDAVVYEKLRNEASFKAIWEKERNLLFPDSRYLNTYPEEYFAEAFAMFYKRNFKGASKTKSASNL
ncbi:hypothetical protein JOC77_001980 [Peribacillus deserti]|uniref:ATLF-like domain-containing protein n=1 Tax=Peribacillus deserti TaxID=673318 RepID=A0ABS2QHP6_9BACI|nr:toxin [Peribacillus deserti]MBM7692550.1 hypothetical protein [Peribacillus deserti]